MSRGEMYNMCVPPVLASLSLYRSFFFHSFLIHQQAEGRRVLVECDYQQVTKNLEDVTL